MTLGSTPQPADVIAELGLPLPYTFQKADPAPWELAGLSTASNLIFPTSFANRSLVTETDNITTAATSHAGVSFGEDTPGRWVVVLANHGNTETNAGNTPTCTIGGINAPRLIARSNKNVEGLAVGAAMFAAQPSGTSGTVEVSWNELPTSIIVLRVVLYDLSLPHDSAFITDNQESSNPILVDIPTNGLLIGFVARGAVDEISWSGITEQGADTTDSLNKRRSRAWDYNMSLETGRSVGFSPYESLTDNGVNTAVMASFARA